MRNSVNITSATSPDSLDKYRDGDSINKSISSGSCSTVIGTRPTCYFYKDSVGVNYEEMARCANKYLENNRSKQTVILCNRNISPRQVKMKLKPLLTGDVTLYDAGVEKFDYYNTPLHYGADIAGQREQVKTWINNGGVLLTHDSMFRGCEAETIVFLTQFWGGAVGQTRSGPTRAVSQLCIVTSDYGIKLDEIKQHFNVVDVREDQGAIQSRETDTDYEDQEIIRARLN